MTRKRTHNGNRTGQRRGFALPMVMLLALIGVIVISSMLTRYASQNRFVNRHRVRYIEHHTQRGVQEMVGTWLDLVRGGPLDEIIREDGLAFTLNLEGSRRLDVYVHDGQGTLLTDFAAMNERERQVIEGALVELQGTRFTRPTRSTRPARSARPTRTARPLDTYTRSRGPIAVSVMAAEPEVLKAILVAAEIESPTADRVVESIVQARERGGLTQPDLLGLLQATGITPEMRGLASTVLTVQPTLFAIETRVYDQRRGPMVAHYSGLVQVESRTGGRAATQSTFKPAGPFLSWEVLVVN